MFQPLKVRSLRIENNNLNYYSCFRKTFGPSFYRVRSVNYGQDRLSELALLGIESELEINNDEIIKEFLGASGKR